MTDGSPAGAAPRRAWLPVAIVVLAFVLFGVLKAASARRVGGDFLRHHRAGRLVATGRAEKLYDEKFLRGQHVYAEEREAERAAKGERADRFPEMEFKYDPVYAVLQAPLGSMHPRPAWVIWGAWNGLMIALTFLAARSLAGLPWKWAWLPLLVLLHKVNANVNLGQVNPTAICGVTGALWLAARGKQAGAGAAAAVGAAVKYLPGLAALFFAAKGAWRAVAAFVVAAAVLFVGLPMLVIGPSKGWDLIVEHKQVRMATYADAAPDDLPGHSIKSFAYRVFCGTKYKTGSDEDRVEMDVSVAHADPALVKWTVLALDLALLGFVLAAAWGPLSPPGDLRGALEGGLLVAAIPLVSPEARAPHFLYLALPLTALTAGLLRAYEQHWPRRHLVLALGVAAALLLHSDSESILGSAAHTCSACCALGAAALAVVVAQYLLLRRLPK